MQWQASIHQRQGHATFHDSTEGQSRKSDVLERPIREIRQRPRKATSPHRHLRRLRRLHHPHRP